MSHVANKAIRDCIKNEGLRQWQVAEILCIREETLSRKLRFELPEKEQRQIITLIKAVSREDKEERIREELENLRIEFSDCNCFVGIVEDFLKDIKKGDDKK